jgi:hypothetical protein
MSASGDAKTIHAPTLEFVGMADVTIPQILGYWAHVIG